MEYKPDYKYIPPAHFHFLTPFYDILCNFLGLGRRFREKILDILEDLKIKENNVILDVGCGTGTLMLMLKERYPGLHIIGIDPDKKVLEIAKRKLEKYPDVELINGFAEALPLSKNSVDIAISVLVFHHLPNNIKQKAISEIYRVLKVEGKVIIVDFGKTNNWFIKKLAFLEGGKEYIGGNFEGLISEYLKEAGFKNIQVIDNKFPFLIHAFIAEK